MKTLYSRNSFDRDFIIACEDAIFCQFSPFAVQEVVYLLAAQIFGCLNVLAFQLVKILCTKGDSVSKFLDHLSALEFSFLNYHMIIPTDSKYNDLNKITTVQS